MPGQAERRLVEVIKRVYKVVGWKVGEGGPREGSEK